MSETNNDSRPLYSVGGFNINAIAAELRANGIELTYTTEQGIESAHAPTVPAGVVREAREPEAQ